MTPRRAIGDFCIVNTEQNVKLIRNAISNVGLHTSTYTYLIVFSLSIGQTLRSYVETGFVYSKKCYRFELLFMYGLYLLFDACELRVASCDNALKMVYSLRIISRIFQTTKRSVVSSVVTSQSARSLRPRPYRSFDREIIGDVTIFVNCLARVLVPNMKKIEKFAKNSYAML